MVRANVDLAVVICNKVQKNVLSNTYLHSRTLTGCRAIKYHIK